MEARSRAIPILAVLSAALLAIVASFVLQDSSSSTSSDSVLYCVPNDSPFFITTLNGSAPRARCFRTRDGVFEQVLEEAPSPSEDAKVLNGYVLPGIIESHGHILQYGEMLESVSLYGAESIEDVIARIKKFLNEHSGEGYGTREKWVRGIGWDQAHFGGVMPTAIDLSQDRELADLYIMLDRVDVHCVWTSQKVISLLPDPLTDAPPGGVIVTDPGVGVFCDNAMDSIVFPVAPKPDVAMKTRWFTTAMRELNKVGIVGVGDAGMRPDDVSILQGMAERGELSVRINVMLECKERNTYCPDETRELKLLDAPDGLGGNTLMLGGVKLFADGALGSWGAALLEPYSDKSDTSGTMLINETELTSVVHQWFDAGFQVNVHAIGDRANRAAIDAFESVLGRDCVGCNEARRLRIEHSQIIHPNDQKRIARMGIIPSIQPTHATSDMAYADDRLGQDRLSHSAYRMASLFPPASTDSKGAYPGPVLGSDFPVEPPNPFHGMYAAVTRLSPTTGTSPSGVGGWYPDEKLSVEQALRGFTKNGAYGWFREENAGAVEVGKWADWVVVDRDILKNKSGKSLRDVVVLETWMGGKRVYVDEERVPDVKEELQQRIIEVLRAAWGKWVGFPEKLSADNQYEL